MAISLAPDAASRAADAVVRQLDGGRIFIYPRTGPALAVFRLAAPSAGPASDGTAIFTVPESVVVAEGGTPVRFDAVTPDGSTVFSGTVGDDLIITPSGRVLVPGDVLVFDRLVYSQSRS